MSSLEKSLLRTRFVIPWVVFVCCVLWVEFAVGEEKLNVLQTEIEHRAKDKLTRLDTELIDDSLWQLDRSELERAETLKESFRQYISDRQISPLEVLGIHARTDAERNRYARRWAKLMIEDAERVLAFQRAYDFAVRDLLDDQPLIELANLPVRAAPIPKLLPSDRLVVFVKLDCAACDDVLQHVFRAGRNVSGVDVYVGGLPEGDALALNRWARRQGIPPSVVQSKRITLNFDDGLLAHVHPRAKDVPVVMRRRGDRLDPLDPWELR